MNEQKVLTIASNRGLAGVSEKLTDIIKAGYKIVSVVAFERRDSFAFYEGLVVVESKDTNRT
jgi:hypothetical protein